MSKFFSEKDVFYQMMWENIVNPDRLRMAVWRMRFACWMTKG